MLTTKPIALLLTGTITALSVAPSVGASIARQTSVAQCDARLESDFGPPEGCETGSTPPKASAQFQLSGSSTAANFDILMMSGRSFYVIDETTVVDAITDVDYFVRLGDQKITTLAPQSSQRPKEMRLEVS